MHVQCLAFYYFHCLPLVLCSSCPSPQLLLVLQFAAPHHQLQRIFQDLRSGCILPCSRSFYGSQSPQGESLTSSNLVLQALEADSPLSYIPL